MPTSGLWSYCMKHDKLSYSRADKPKRNKANKQARKSRKANR